jgi:hypothetical protein
VKEQDEQHIYVALDGTILMWSISATDQKMMQFKKKKKKKKNNSEPSSFL